MEVTCSDNNTKELEPVSRFRRILPQILAATAKNFLLVCLGASFGYSTVIIPTLLGGKESIKMTGEQASWFGSFYYFCQPIGSLFSGILMDPIGRKRALMLVNLPHVVGWILMWRATDVTMLFAAHALLGIGTGLMEAPICTYIGEICEPSVRGVLISYSSIFSALGTFIVFFVGTVLHWRTTAAVCLAIPLSAILVVAMVPETPIWLLSKGRNEDALKSLCWLRGWVQPSQVKEEFDSLMRYNNNNFKCKLCEPNDHNSAVIDPCPHANITLWNRLTTSITGLRRKETLRPLIIISVYFACVSMTGLSAMRPNLVNVFKAFNMTIDAHWATVGAGLLSILGAIVTMTLIKYCGKRYLALVCITGSCLSTLYLGIYAYYYIPHDTRSYATTITATGEPSTTPMIFFIFIILFNSTGLGPVAWVLLSEIFPYRTRGNASGIVAALFYFFSFIATKTYIYVENYFNIYGAFYFYSVITLIGLAFSYLFLPETENCKQEEIEAYFSKTRVKIFANDFVAKKIKAILSDKYKPSDTFANKYTEVNEMNLSNNAIDSKYVCDNNGYVKNDEELNINNIENKK